jgi:hypothetical protein
MIQIVIKRSPRARAKTCGLILAALSVLTAGGNANAQRHEIRYQDRFSGAAALSSFDGNGDGVPGYYVTFDGWSTLGLINGAIMVEYDFANIAPDANCPTGMVRLPILVSAGNRALTVRALALEAGQVFMRDDTESSFFCLNAETGAVWMSIKGKFEGGLGVLEGATGDYVYEGSAQVLLQDAAGLPFGVFTLETKGTMNLPKPPR